jgi:hypothetical protein
MEGVHLQWFWLTGWRLEFDAAFGRPGVEGVGEHAGGLFA